MRVKPLTPNFPLTQSDFSRGRFAFVPRNSRNVHRRANRFNSCQLLHSFARATLRLWSVPEAAPRPAALRIQAGSIFKRHHSQFALIHVNQMAC